MYKLINQSIKQLINKSIIRSIKQSKNIIFFAGVQTNQSIKPTKVHLSFHVSDNKTKIFPGNLSNQSINRSTNNFFAGVKKKSSFLPTPQKIF